MKRHLGPVSVVGAILFMAMTVFAGDVYLNDTKWGTYTSIALDANGKLVITGTPDTPPPPTGNTIKGKITNSTDFLVTIGIPNVTVNLTGDATKSTTTSSDGSYQFTGLTGGVYIVTPSKANYAFTFTKNPPTTENHADVTVTSNQTVTADFTAEPTTTGAFQISGTVFDKSGATGISGATVEIRLGSTKVDETTTGSDGAYALTELLDGLTYRVTPVSGTKTFNPAYSDVTINNGSVSGKNFTELAPPPPPTTGQFTAAIKGAYRLDTLLISNSTGGNAGFGYGFKDQCTPGPASIREGGMTYFLADTNWISSAYTTLKFKWYDFSLTKNFKINLYAIDSSDNGTLLNSSSQNQAYFSITKKAGYRYLLEVDTTNCSSGFALGVTWPK